MSKTDKLYDLLASDNIEDAKLGAGIYDSHKNEIDRDYLFDKLWAGNSYWNQKQMTDGGKYKWISRRIDIGIMKETYIILE